MYRRQRRPASNFFTLILLGFLAGMMYLVYDNMNQRSVQTPEITPVLEATIQQTSPTSVLSEATLPVPLATAGMAIEAEIFIPSIGVSAPIIPVFLDGESWNVSQLGMNVGYLQGTAWLDEIGNVVLSGHVDLRDGRAGIFRKLPELKTGAQILLVYEGSERSYVVSELMTVEPEDLTPLYPTDFERLTLITCDAEAYDFLQDTYQKRIVVIAERVS
ncbi:MAG: class F sortase [Anaerolineae bacterium]|nr:class F sortase [Anaerolineae bacterium]